jgi:hypothetical protein
MRCRRAPASDHYRSLSCFPGLGPSGRLPEAYPGYASLPRPQYLQLMVPGTMVELLAARFTKSHPALVSWSFLCPGLAPDNTGCFPAAIPLD